MEADAAERRSRLAPCADAADRSVPVHVTAIQASVDTQISLLKSIGLNAFVCLPLLVGERLVGTFGFGRRWTDHFGEEDIGFLKTVAAYAAIAKDRLQGEAALRISEKRLQEKIGREHV